MGTLISSNALADSARRLLFLKRRYGLDIRSGLSSDGPPALVAHSPVGGLLSRFRPGETQSRRGTHSSDSVHSANPEECGAGVTHPDTAHEMRIPLRPLRMSKPYRRLRKRRLRSESVKALLEMIVTTVSPSSET